jgi:hypothetical protein
MVEDNQKVILVSSNFNPGHYSHLLANFKLLIENKFDAYMYHHELFNNMSEIENERIFNRFDELKKIGKIDFAIFWFPSIKNIFDIVSLRFNYSTKIVYVFHEPFDGIKSYFKSGFGFFKIIKILLISLINYLIVLLSNKIILPSKKSLATFESKYLHTKKKYVSIPLLFDDESDVLKKYNCRNNISYIGTVAEDHAFDEFVIFTVHALQNNWFPRHNFLIATKSSIPTSQRLALSPFVKSGKVIIEEGKPMSNADINAHYNSSVVIWNAYRRSMQSGVLPKAYMFGTPLIVSEANLSEFFIGQMHGVVVSNKYKAQELKEAIEDVMLNFKEYSLNCRNTFLSAFYFKAHEKTFIDFIMDQKTF